MRWQGFLTGRGGAGRTVPAAALAAVSAGDPHRVVKAFLNEYRALFGHDSTALNFATVKRDYVTAHNGLRTTVWAQQLDGIPVFEAVLLAHVTRRGELVNIESHLLADPAEAADAAGTNHSVLESAPPVLAARAIANAAQTLGVTIDPAALASVATAAGAEKRQQFSAPGFVGAIEASLVWLPVSDTAMRLCWDVTLRPRERDETSRVLVDAQTGEALLRRCQTVCLSDASYRVFTSDSPSPFSPGWSTPNAGQPPQVSRALVVTSAVDAVASPNGWIDDTNNTTLGNNVDAHLDRDANNVPDPGSRPVGSPFRVFDFPEDLGQDPVTYTNAAVVQLFYWCNWMHDKLYELGFTEAAGNFQADNFGRGGVGNDAMQADAQDGGGVNNESFTMTADGTPGRIEVYLFTGPSPDRDGDLDAELVLHEYTHGLSSRLVGGGVGLSALQPRCMAEGWSDFYPLSLLSEPADDPNATYAMGGYAAYQLNGLTQNYYYGLRRYPYTTDMTKNPLTFKDIDPAQASAHSGVPRSPLVGNGISTSASEVHNAGEVWCVTLWEARANLIKKYGYATGNQRILQLVTDGMKLSPVNPNYIQARDAILQADQVDNSGANLNELWAAFAKRGMGLSATAPTNWTTTGVVEAFDPPDNLKVLPVAAGVFTPSGPDGGLFNPLSQTYTLTSATSLNWTATKSASWLDLSSTAGSLAAGASNAVTVSINAGANAFAPGVYGAAVTFSNVASGVAQTRQVTLDVMDSLSVTPQTNFTSSGSVGGPFSPVSQVYVVSNQASSARGWTATATATWLSLSASAGTLTPGASTNVTASINANASTLAAGTYAGSVVFSNTVNGVAQSRSVSLIVLQRVYFFPLDTDPGWTRTGQWAFGKPTGGGGTSYGFPDPTSGATGTNVFGVNLNGDYSTTVGAFYLTTGPLNFAGQTSTRLRFQRWLNTDTYSLVPAIIEISTNGATWYQVWKSSGIVTDSAWNVQQYNISSWADNCTNVTVRWDYLVASGAHPYSGWNIDDIEFLAAPMASNSPPFITAASISPSAPNTTQDLAAAVTSYGDPDGDPVTFAYQWQESTDDVAFSNIGFTAATLPASATAVGRYYRVVVTPNDGHVDGAPFTTASVQVALDFDGNGLDDDWEVKYFGHIGVDPWADPDGDGIPNIQEYVAGTSPIDANSAFRITSITTDGSNVVVDFTTLSNKLYALESADDPRRSKWNTVAADVPGTGGIVTVTDPGAVGPVNRYYRARLLTLTTPLDTDGDGLPDSWELQYFGDLSKTGSDDPDNDGMSNLQEFVAGTDPTNAMSALRITSIALNGIDVLVSFTTSSNKFYELQDNDDVATLDWYAVLTDIPGTGGIVTVTVPNAADVPNRFYRVKVLP